MQRLTNTDASWRRGARWWCALATVLVIDTSACSDGETRRAPGVDPMGAPPRDAVAIRLHLRRELAEGSAAVMSVAQPGVIFTLNDSGNEPALFAFDTTGADRGAWRVTPATNRDWESASLGPCDAAAPAAIPRCLYIGDTGDNDAVRPSRAIYRVAEPAARDRGFTGVVEATRLTYVYADQPHDVESMYVGPTGTIYLITKRLPVDAQGQRRPTLVFQIDAAAWGRDTVAVAVLADSIPAAPGSAPLRGATDAALSPDNRYVAVRTYSQVYTFAASPSDGRIRSDVVPTVCNVAGLGERQGEGITWLGTSGKLLLTSEGAREPAWVIACPLP